MMKVGLTGGIGSGKTTVARMFEELGIPVYYSDNEAKRLMNESESLKNELLKVFGKEVYKEGELNRPYLAEIVFKDTGALKKLNSIVHPAVEEDFIRWVSLQNSIFIIQESALIFEGKNEGKYEQVILVTAPMETRIMRVMERDRVSREQVMARMRNQSNMEDVLNKADFIIENNSLEQTRQQVTEVYNQILLIAKS